MRPWRWPFWVVVSAALGIGGCMGQIGELLAGEGEGPAREADQANEGGTGPVDPDGGMLLPADDVPVDFFVDIQPILNDNCVRCHGGVRELPLAPKTPLNLQSREQAARVLGQAGDAETSTLYLRVLAQDPNVRMPLGQQALPADKINKIRRWIFQGAPWPSNGPSRGQRRPAWCRDGERRVMGAHARRPVHHAEGSTRRASSRPLKPIDDTDPPGRRWT